MVLQRGVCERFDLEDPRNVVELRGFTLPEVGTTLMRRRLLRGGFPRAFLARSDIASISWREDFIRTFIERDVPALGAYIRDPSSLRRLWTMLAHRHAQVWNGARLAGALGESYATVKRHVAPADWHPGGARRARQVFAKAVMS